MTIPPVPSDTDRLAEGPAPLTDEQVARFTELIDMHRQYGPALSIEGEAQLLVEVLRLRAENIDMRRRVLYAAAIVSGDAAEMLGGELRKARAEVQQLQGRLDTAEGQLDKARAALVQTAVDLYGFWQFAVQQEGTSKGWTPDVTAREEGKFRGAAWSLQGFLVSLGEADEEDDEAGAAYEAIENAMAALGLGGEASDG